MEAGVPNSVFQELLFVHGMVRRDLETVTRLAAAVQNGMPADELTDEVENLKTNGPLWQLKVNCLHYCRFVHHHHRLEDLALFPRVRQLDPDLDPVVDKLEADHRVVAVQLDAVEEAAQALGEEDSTESRARVAETLDALATHLLEHLRFEEESLEGLLSRMASLSG
jgi:hypothetical protein